MWSWHYFGSYNPNNFVLFPLLVPVVVWSLVWKGLALYKAAQNGQKGWFVALLVFNTLGILEIMFLLLFSTTKIVKKKKA